VSNALDKSSITKSVYCFLLILSLAEVTISNIAFAVESYFEVCGSYFEILLILSFRTIKFQPSGLRLKEVPISADGDLKNMSWY